MEGTVMATLIVIGVVCVGGAMLVVFLFDKHIEKSRGGRVSVGKPPKRTK
jgi:hypothetical protein